MFLTEISQQPQVEATEDVMQGEICKCVKGSMYDATLWSIYMWST